MKTQSTRANIAQNPTQPALFSIYVHRQCNATGAVINALKKGFVASRLSLLGSGKNGVAYADNAKQSGAVL